MVDGGGEIRVGDRLSLGIGDRHQRHVAEADIQRLDVVKVLPSVQSGHRPIGDRPKQREVKLVDVEMQDIEFVGHLAHAVEHQHVVRNRIPYIRVQSQCHRHAAHQLGAGNRIAAGKQGHVVTLPNQFVGEIGHDSLATTIQPRWHALHERRDLRNFHVFLSRRTGYERNVLRCEKFPRSAAETAARQPSG